jgi:hypothetical protein
MLKQVIRKLDKALQRYRYRKIAEQLEKLESGLDYKFVVYHKKIRTS